MKKLSASTIFIIFALGWLALFCWGIWGVAQGLLGAESNEDYCYYLSNMVYIVGALIFSCLYFIMVYLVYINKQYSKWCIRVYYLLGVSVLLYYGWAGIFSKSVYNQVEPEYLENFPRMVHRLYTGPLYWIIIGYFFTPKILKDARKLKEEQELTV